jgi:ATP phosphoribosyltransferase regulatory subunit
VSKPKGFEKPIGVRDYLPEAVARLRSIESNVLNCMYRWGYDQIMTPTLEYYDTVGVASSTEDKKLFKFLDRQGATLVLRSEMTAPIARVVSSLLKDKPLPLRLCYHSQVYRAMEQEAGRDAEFFQTGLELIGDASPEADAEVIALSIASLQAAGVQSFKMAIGHIGFLNGWFTEMLQDQIEAEQGLKKHLLSRDFVGYRDTIRQLSMDKSHAKALEQLLHLRGDVDVCQQALTLTRHPEALNAIHHLQKVWSVLEAYQVTAHITIDLTMIGDFSYYTGMVFEGYAAKHAFPVCSGGRYDNLLSQFGRPCASTGFALKTNRILELFDEVPSQGPSRKLILYTVVNRSQALQVATQLRKTEHTMVITKCHNDEDNTRLAMEIEPLDNGTYLVDGELYQDIIWFH